MFWHTLNIDPPPLLNCPQSIIILFQSFDYDLFQIFFKFSRHMLQWKLFGLYFKPILDGYALFIIEILCVIV